MEGATLLMHRMHPSLLTGPEGPLLTLHGMQCKERKGPFTVPAWHTVYRKGRDVYCSCMTYRLHKGKGPLLFLHDIPCTEGKGPRCSCVACTLAYRHGQRDLYCSKPGLLAEWTIDFLSADLSLLSLHQTSQSGGDRLETCFFLGCLFFGFCYRTSSSSFISPGSV